MPYRCHLFHSKWSFYSLQQKGLDTNFLSLSVSGIYHHIYLSHLHRGATLTSPSISSSFVCRSSTSLTMVRLSPSLHYGRALTMRLYGYTFPSTTAGPGP